jgi:hypothetical protein
MGAGIMNEKIGFGVGAVPTALIGACELYTQVGILILITAISVKSCQMMLVTRLLKKARLLLAELAFERKIFFVILLNVVVHRILLFGHFVAMRAGKVTVAVSDIFRGSHRCLVNRLASLESIFLREGLSSTFCGAADSRKV